MISFHAPLLFYAAARLVPIIVMFALYTSRNKGKLQRAYACGDSEIHVCRSGLFASVVLHIELHGCKSCVSVPVVGFTCADPAILPPSPFTLNFTGADCGLLPPSYDSRVQIRLFCPRCPSLMLSRTAARARSSRGDSQFAAGYDDTGRAARKALMLSKITTFRVVKTTTLISVK